MDRTKTYDTMLLARVSRDMKERVKEAVEISDLEDNISEFVRNAITDYLRNK